jgi:predicted  nucleic acid-binding Zn-ribbon protein
MSERLNRIEAALERLEQRQEEIQAELDRQLPVIAALRASAADLSASTEALLQITAKQQSDIEVLTTFLRRHISDSHGGQRSGQ